MATQKVINAIKGLEARLSEAVRDLGGKVGEVNEAVRDLGARVVDAVRDLGTKVGEIGDAVNRGLTETRQVTSGVVTEARRDLADRIENTRHTCDAISRDLGAARGELGELRVLIEELRSDLAGLRAAPGTGGGPAEPPAGDSHPPVGPPEEPPTGGSGSAPAPEPEPEPEPATDTTAGGALDPDRHLNLLVKAARTATARLSCHRDLWAFLMEKAAHEQPHFRVPGAVTDAGNGRVEVTLSGRSVIAALTALWEIRRANARLEDLALATALYDTIAEVVVALEHGPQQGGESDVVITVDRRNPRPNPVTCGTDDATDDATG